MKGTSRRILIAASMIALGLTLAAAARADDVDNPQYAAWAKFGVGSSATLSADSTVGPNKIPVHVDLTRTLKSVTADSLDIEVVAKVDAMGHSNNPTPYTRTIKAKAPDKEMKDNGTQDVSAIGKTFSCKVIELTGTSASDNGPPARNGRPPADVKATIYVNADVPGGMVKMELGGTTGSTSYVLTAMDVK